MDPNAVLKNIDDFLKRHQTGDEVDIWCQDLYDWINRGGFKPDWARFPIGTGYYKCREVSHKRGVRI